MSPQPSKLIQEGRSEPWGGAAQAMGQHTRRGREEARTGSAGSHPLASLRSGGLRVFHGVVVRMGRGAWLLHSLMKHPKSARQPITAS